MVEPTGGVEWFEVFNFKPGQCPKKCVALTKLEEGMALEVF